MGAAAIALEIAGGAVGAYGAYEKGVAGKQAADFNADQSRRNAAMAYMQMGYEQQSAQEQSQQVGRQERGVLGSGRAAYAAGDVVVGQGSALSWEHGVQKAGAEDLARISQGLQRKQYGLSMEQQDYLRKADMQTSQGKYAMQAGELGALSSMLGSAGNSASMYAMMA